MSLFSQFLFPMSLFSLQNTFELTYLVLFYPGPGQETLVFDVQLTKLFRPSWSSRKNAQHAQLVE